MSEAPDKEGWGVPQRVPLLAAAAVLILLLVGLTVLGRLYRAHFEPGTRPPAIAMPAPRLETIETAPGESHGDPRGRPPAGIDRAMAEVAAEGNAVWNGAP